MTEQETNQQQPPAGPPAHVEPAPVPPAPASPAAPFRRSPGLALVFSFFPGLGHLYLGLYQRAFAIFLCFALAIWFSEHSHLGILVAFVWFFAVIDAYRQAQCINLGLCPEPITGSTKPAGSHRGALGFGIFLLVIGVLLLYNQFYPIDFTFLEDWWPLLLVLGGLYLVAAHFREKQRQARRGAEPEVPPAGPGTGI
jgi:hypothetical protein